MIASNTENACSYFFFWSETWTSYVESTGTSELNWFLNLVLKQLWEQMTHSMISWGWTNLMWSIPPKKSYLLARNATYSVSFEWHLLRITLTSFLQKKTCFSFGQEVASPLFVCGISQKKSADFCFLGMTSSSLYILQSPKWTVSLFRVYSHFTTAVLVFLSMLIICPRWIQCFPWFSTLTRSPSPMHKASKLVDSFFFAPKKRDMIQDDSILHKQLPSSCSHSSSPIMSLIWPKLT
jgi:hypothetical protein